MLPRLESFYKLFLLPELAAPRYGTYTGIRKPKAPWFNVHQESTACSTAGSNVTHTRENLQTNSSKNSTITCSTTTTSSTSDSFRNEEKKQPPETTNNLQVSKDDKCKGRARRKKAVKFVGRGIIHLWTVCEKKENKVVQG
ncbi:uncharacterized protein LOC128558639 [Mercenaria mercenaria]|uniref:uncharacterized protein LOC128558639 n=1 Tax=Mercenaria mercenaria TaxID=6596 RepID=UPI00234F4C0D|nr:uncharacterized protein LOC128558639 [Mercenaria mercenaria]